MIAHAVDGTPFTFDDEDECLVLGHRWYIVDRLKHGFCQYVMRSGSILLHREIMRPPKGYDVDHINGDALNNCRDNLRIVTRGQNLASHHHRTRIPSATGYIGAYPTPNGKFSAIISFRNKLRNLGTFETAEEAALARDREAYKLYGEYARLNFPREDGK